MDDDQLRFPTGRSVRNCRTDAKLIARNTGVALSKAQDQVAAQNGGAGTWARSLHALRGQHPQHLTPQRATQALPLMTAADVQAVLDKHPITHFGYGPSGGVFPGMKAYSSALTAGQAQLLNHLDECNKAARFLGHVAKRKTDNPKVGSSYGLKHQAEGFLKRLADAPLDPYVANGAFICAAVHMGFDMKVRWDSPNVTFNMSSRSPVFEWARLASKARSAWALASISAEDRLEELEIRLGLVPTPKRLPRFE